MHASLQLPPPDATKVELALLKFDSDLSGGLNEQQFADWFRSFIKERSASHGVLPALAEVQASNGAHSESEMNIRESVYYTPASSFALPEVTNAVAANNCNQVPKAPTLLRQSRD